MSFKLPVETAGSLFEQGVDLVVELLQEILVIYAGGRSCITCMDAGYPTLLIDKDRCGEGEVCEQAETTAGRHRLRTHRTDSRPVLTFCRAVDAARRPPEKRLE